MQSGFCCWRFSSAAAVADCYSRCDAAAAAASVDAGSSASSAGPVSSAVPSASVVATASSASDVSVASASAAHLGCLLLLVMQLTVASVSYLLSV